MVQGCIYSCFFFNHIILEINTTWKQFNVESWTYPHRYLVGNGTNRKQKPKPRKLRKTPVSTLECGGGHPPGPVMDKQFWVLESYTPQSCFCITHSTEHKPREENVGKGNLVLGGPCHWQGGGWVVGFYPWKMLTFFSFHFWDLLKGGRQYLVWKLCFTKIIIFTPKNVLIINAQVWQFSTLFTNDPLHGQFRSVCFTVWVLFRPAEGKQTLKAWYCLPGSMLPDDGNFLQITGRLRIKALRGWRDAGCSVFETVGLRQDQWPRGEHNNERGEMGKAEFDVFKDSGRERSVRKVFPANNSRTSGWNLS